jgi:hypothetical protein
MTKRARKKVIPFQKKKPGRKPTGKDPLMALRVPPDIRARVEKLAAETGMTLSKAILSVLEKHLPKDEDGQ